MRSKRHSARKRQRVHKLHVEHPSRDVKTTGREAETARVRKRRRTRELVSAMRAMLTGLVAMMAVSGSVIGLHQVFYENPDFSIGPNIHIYTDGQLTTDRVLALVEIPQDQNIFTVDLQNLQERIQEISVVRNVRVERRMPNQLVIQIEERRPIAWLSVPAHNIHPEGPHQVLVDRDGVPMHGRDILTTTRGLPVVQASGAGAYPIGKPIPDESLRIASALIDWWVEQPELGVGQIEKITQLNGYSIRTQFEGGLDVVFGIKDLNRQLSNLDLILRHAVYEQRQVKTVNLIPKKNIPVVYHDSAMAPPDNLRPVSGNLLE